MALTYKTDVITLNAANTDFTILTASASSTLVKNITWIHDDHNTNVILSITKSGGSKIAIGEYVATANTSTKIWTDVLPLEANDILHLQSDHISGSDVGYCVISYVEDTASVAGQSIAVHTDVSISGITDGQVLEWNNSTTQFEPATASGGATDTDGLTEGSTNLYFTDARVAANSAVAANTAKVGITTQQSSDITANNAKVGITPTQASEITANTAKVSGIANVNADTAPQLGGTLDVNGNELQSNGDFIVRVDADNNTSNSKFVVKNGAGNEAFSVNEEGTNISITGADNNIKIGNLDGSLGTFNGISLNDNLSYPGIVGFAGGSSSSSNFFLFGEVVDIRAGGASDSSMRIVETSGEAQVVINKAFPVPTTHTLYVGGNGKFDDNVDFAQGIDVTGNITVSGTVDGIDVGVDVAANTAKVGYTDAAVDTRIGAASITDLDDTPGSLIANNILQVNPGGNAVILASKRTAYSSTEINADQNRLFEADLTPSSNTIVDFLNDEAATASGANAKNFLGWWDGTEVILEGMVDTGAQPVENSAVGEALWLGTGGALSASAPTTENHYSRIVGYHVGTEQGGNALIYFKPSPDWVQID